LKRIYKEPSEPELPYVYRAELSNHRFVGDAHQKPVICSGKGLTHAQAQMSALGESVERYSGSCWSKSSVTYETYGGLTGAALDPRGLVLYTEEQYERLPYAPFREDSVLGWVRGTRAFDRTPVWIPALAVYLSYETQARTEFLSPVTSNGLATASTLSDALLRATYELIERDAFMLSWMHRLSGTRLDWERHGEEAVVGLCRSYERRGVDIELYRLPTDTSVHVVMALGIQRQGHGPAVVVGLGASLSLSSAARSAILEVAQVRPALRIRMNASDTRERMALLREDPMRVTELEDHDLLYACPEMLHEFQFLRSSPRGGEPWDLPGVGPESPVPVEDQPERELAVLVDELHRLGHELLFVDVSPPDMVELGFYTVRAILPHFQPIHFGAREPRLGGERLLLLPKQLGLRSKVATLDDLNPMPHPLS
jgi:ribosomal protein S12 methylthiotransferase accessory factor